MVMKLIQKPVIGQQQLLLSVVETSKYVQIPRYFIKEQAETTGFFPTNQNTLYLMCLFYSDNVIITVHGRPAICTLLSWFKSSCLFISLYGFCEVQLTDQVQLTEEKHFTKKQKFAIPPFKYDCLILIKHLLSLLLKGEVSCDSN